MLRASSVYTVAPCLGQLEQTQPGQQQRHSRRTELNDIPNLPGLGVGTLDPAGLRRGQRRFDQRKGVVQGDVYGHGQRHSTEPVNQTCHGKTTQRGGCHSQMQAGHWPARPQTWQKNAGANTTLRTEAFIACMAVIAVLGLIWSKPQRVKQTRA